MRFIVKLSNISPVLITINLFPCENGFYTNERFLPNPYFLYIHKGNGLFIINNIKYYAHKGDLFFCPKGIGNTIIADTETPFLLSGIDFDFTASKYNASFEDFEGYKPQMNITSNNFALQLINEMIKAVKNHTPYSTEYANSLLKSFILFTAQMVKSEQASSRTNVKELLNFIENNSMRELTAAEIAKNFNYHPSSVNRIVKSMTGLSIRQYQISLRIKKAMDLLIYTNKSITEIASLCGYSNIFYFSRQFYEKTGVYPSSYKNTRH